MPLMVSSDMNNHYLAQLTTWYQGHVLNWGREHSAFPVHWSGILSLSHCGLLIVSQRFVAGLRLTFLTSTYRDFIFTLLVFSIVDICTARPTRVVVGLALWYGIVEFNVPLDTL